MDWLRSLVEQMQTFWAGLSPEGREGLIIGIISGVAVAIILGTLAWIWRTGGGIFKKFLRKKDKTPPAATKEEADEQRGALLDGVETAWIQGVLEKSLYQEVLIALDVDGRSGMVAPPVKITIQTPAGPPQELPSTQNILQIFDESNGKLLTLGEPGSGKTITLLTLARQLIQRARNDPDHPLPVVFNLASWAEKQQSLDAWLIDELETKYRVPKPLGRYWVESRELLLLLDGLDEVREDLRSQCIQTINDYADARVKMAVCSRRQEYERAVAKVKLAMQQAIWLQPLSTTQIFAYLRQLGARAANVGKVLKEDVDLLELARTPLLLNVMLLAYQDGDDQVEDTNAPIQKKREQLFDRYIRRVLLHHGSQKHPWAPSQVLRRLRWIARRLLAHNETEFRLENLQSDWLTTKETRLYHLWLWGEPVFFGLAFGLFFGLVAGQRVGLFFGLIIGLFSWQGGRVRSDIQPVWTIQWKRSVQIMKKSLLFGVSVGIIFGLTAGLDIGLTGGLIGVLVGGLFLGLVGGINAMLFPIVSNIEPTIKPNQPIWQSGKNGLFFGLFFGIVSGLVYKLVYRSVYGLVIGLVVSLIIGLVLGRKYGLDAFIKHWTLRFILWRYDHTPAPWRYVAFLDYAVQRILLRRVGSGWIFIHRMIMEHIAQLDDELIDELDRELVCHLKRRERLSDKEIRRITPFSQKQIARLGQACSGG